MSTGSNEQYSSIEYMNINHRCTLNNLICLLSYTPRLSHLTCEELVGLLQNISIQIPITLSYLTDISIGFSKIQFQDFEIFIQNFCRQIKVLRIITLNYFAYLDVNRWKRLIEDNIPHIYQFYFQYYQFIDNSILYAPYQWLINQSTSSFWINRRCLIECHLDIDSWSHGQFIYSLRFSKNKTSTSNDEKHAAKFIQLTVSRLDFTQYSLIIAENTRVFLLTAEFTHLNISSKWVSISTLIKLVWYLPNLHSLRVSSLRLMEIKILSIDDIKHICLASKENKIIEVHLAQMIEFQQGQFLINLCLCIQYFTIECLRGGNLEMFVRFILMENYANIPNLSMLSLYGSICKVEIIENFKIMINREQQLHDYIVKFICDKIYFERKKQ